MRTLMLFSLFLGIFAAPAGAASDRAGSELRPGSFVGAQLKLSLGGKTSSKPLAALTIAPTRSQISATGAVRTTIGDGLALNFAPESRPTFTLAGVRADTALAPQRGRGTDAQPKLGVSTGGWVAIGVGVAVLVGGVYFVHLVHEADKNSD
ncbi:MAG: hypothetical protein ACJ8E3_04545 [Sphingomicrobium sp.]